jgi:uncharacterized membrane protein
MRKWIVLTLLLCWLALVLPFGNITSGLAAGFVEQMEQGKPVIPAQVYSQDEAAWSGMPLAWVLMAFMLAALGLVIWQVWRAFQGASVWHAPTWLNWSIPFLSLIGLGVAGYLTYVYATYTPVVCGPLGDCDAVQNSKYAYLFGVIPVGMFGVAGYLGILITWVWARFRKDKLAELAPVAIMGMAVFGTLFSVYLTYLEIFVIFAVCIWCLSSALLISLVMVAALPPAAAWLSMQDEEET